jgi:acyl-CoA hydrolase
MDVKYVATEHAITNLRGKSPQEGAETLIALAGPAFRAELTIAAQRITLI